MEKNRVFIIGAPKCGTTSLANWLGRHELVQLAHSKEPGYFRTGERKWIIDAHYPDLFHARGEGDYMSDRSEYERQFGDTEENVWLLDASTDYFSDPGTCGRIKDEVDGATRIICVLRDPIDRMYSEFCHTLRDDVEVLDFSGSLAVEEERIERGFQPLFFHARRSRYWNQISRWRSTFGEDRVLVLPYSALHEGKALQETICKFLQIPISEIGKIPNLNVSLGRSNDSMVFNLKKYAKRYAKKVLRRNQERRAVFYPEFSDEDKKLAFSLIEDDIKRCIADSTIPSSEWSTCRIFL